MLHRSWRGAKAATAAWLVTAASVVTALPAHAATAAPIGNIAAAWASDGAHVVAETPIDSSMVDLSIDSPALGQTTKVRLVLPADWRRDPQRAWPTLYMLPGSLNIYGYAAWTQETNFESFMRGRDVLSVLPGEGIAAIATDYLFGPHYATFTAVELPQILGAGYRSNGVNAIAGLSAGGYSALALAGEYPGEFKAAASYSGLADTQYPGISLPIIDALLTFELTPYFDLWGNPSLDQPLWAANNPVDLTAKMKSTSVWLSWGNGKPGPFDTNPIANAALGLLESAAPPVNEAFEAAAKSNGVRVTTDTYNGTHDWPYWQREFHRSWPLLAAAMGVAVGSYSTQS